MRNAKFLFLALAAGLLLGGCGAADAISSGAPSGAASFPALPPASSQAAPAGSGSRVDIPCTPSEGRVVPIEGTLTPEAVGRPATTKLSFCAEGIAEEIPATLYIGDGYSIYLPDGAWKQTQVASRVDYTADTFSPADNEAVTLDVQPDYTDLEQGGLTLADAYAALLSEGYTQSDDNDHLFALTQDNTVVCQYVVELSDVVWYVRWAYPDTSEYLEGWGTSLPVIAETFAVNPPAVP